MNIYDIDITKLSYEQLETYVGMYYIKQENGKQYIHHSDSSARVLELNSIKPKIIFDDEWRQTASNVVKKNLKHKEIIEQAMFKTRSLLDGISKSTKYSIPWINQYGDFITLTHELEIIQYAEDNTALLTIGQVTNESIKKTKQENHQTLETQNRLLKELNEQAIELNSLLVFSIDLSTFPECDYFTSNKAFEETLGLKENKDGYIPMKDLINTQTMDLDGANSMKKLLLSFSQLKHSEIKEFTNVLVKQQNITTGQVVYLKYNARITRYENNTPIRINGYVTNNTNEVLMNQQNKLLSKQNQELRKAQDLAVKSGKVLIWYQNSSETRNEKLFYGNDLLFEKLGIQRYKDNRFLITDFNNTILSTDQEGFELYKVYLHENKRIIDGTSEGYNKILVKHINLKTKEIFYFEHNLIVEERFDSGIVNIRGGYLTDVTKETKYKLKIEYLVQYDTVTNLHNRHYFEEYTQKKLPSSYTVIVIDIDGLKFINDAFGHIPGDKAIHLLSSIIKDEFTKDSTLFRIGGDEFVVISSDINTKSIDSRINSIHQTIAQKAKQNKLIFSASIGYEIVNHPNTSFDSAFTTAENKMYRSKLSKRKNRKSSSLNALLEILYSTTNESNEQYLRLKDNAINIMKHLGYNRYVEINEMDTICKLHNIGLIMVPHDHLEQQESTNQKDTLLLQSHAESSYKIVKNLIDSDTISQSILHHHEYYNGTGYPLGLEGENIPLFSRILRVVDTFEDLTNYQKLDINKANQYLNNHKNELFDPIIVDAFIQTIKKEKEILN